MNDNVPHEGQNPFLFEQGSRQDRNVYAYADENDEVAVSMDFEMANNTEAAEDQNTFVKQEDEQACRNDESASKDDRMIEDTSTNDQQTQLGDQANNAVDPVDTFHRLVAEILVASKENKGQPVQEIYDNLHNHLSYIEWLADSVVGDVRRRLMDTVLDMFENEAQKCMDASFQARAFRLWQYWAQLNIDQLDENSFAAIYNNDRKYLTVYPKEYITLYYTIMHSTQACYKAPDADMSTADYATMVPHETAAFQSNPEYPMQADDGAHQFNYPQGLVNGQALHYMSNEAYPEVPTCVRQPLATEDHVNIQSVASPVPVATQAQPSTQAASKPRRKTAKAAAVKSGSNNSPPDGLYLPDRDHPMFGDNGPLRGIAYAIKNGKKSWVANPNYADDKVNSKVFGDNHIDVGDWWPAQSIACFNGAHGSWYSGIAGDKTEGAHSIVKSGGTYDSLDQDRGNVLFYSGSGAHDSTASKPKNSLGTDILFASYQKKQPVRVLRAAPKKVKDGSDWSPSVGIRYDGLYEVVGHQTVLNSEGGTCVRFELHRHENQTDLNDLRTIPTKAQRDIHAALQKAYPAKNKSN